MLIKIKGSEINPECPLCDKTFEKIKYEGQEFFVCLPCFISINVNDPSVHLWKGYTPEEEKELICINPKCEEAVRFFFRADGFMKTYCPRCKSTLATENLPPRIDKPKYTAPSAGGIPYYE